MHHISTGTYLARVHQHRPYRYQRWGTHSANEIVPELFAKTSLLLNEKNTNSLDFIKESYPPHPFHIESERKFNLIKSDLEDILLEISDSTMKINIHKYIDDIIFEIQIYISEIETKEDKKLVEECILRISSFLENHNLSIFKVNMIQNIDGIIVLWYHTVFIFFLPSLF